MYTLKCRSQDRKSCIEKQLWTHSIIISYLHPLASVVEAAVAVALWEGLYGSFLSCFNQHPSRSFPTGKTQNKGGVGGGNAVHNYEKGRRARHTPHALADVQERTGLRRAGPLLSRTCWIGKELNSEIIASKTEEGLLFPI